MSSYLRIHNKLVELIDRGHVVQIERTGYDFEVSVFESPGGRDHFHTRSRYLSEAMGTALLMAIDRWPQ